MIHHRCHVLLIHPHAPLCQCLILYKNSLVTTNKKSFFVLYDLICSAQSSTKLTQPRTTTNLINYLCISVMFWSNGICISTAFICCCFYKGGAGGCGKSRVIEAISDYMRFLGRAHTLRKLAPSSAAAVGINGLTIQSMLHERRSLDGWMLHVGTNS
jgi:hypothetical protein